MSEHPAHGGREYDFGTSIGHNLGNIHPGTVQNLLAEDYSILQEGEIIEGWAKPLVLI